MDEEFKEYRLKLIAVAATKIREGRIRTWKPQEARSGAPVVVLASPPPQRTGEIAKSPVEAYRALSKGSVIDAALRATRSARTKKPVGYSRTINRKAYLFPFYCGDKCRAHYLLNPAFDKTLLYLLMECHSRISNAGSFMIYSTREGKQFTGNRAAINWLVSELNNQPH